ncbi:MAG: GntR family transcriptional regulator [Pseudomonadota bacterium]
MPTQSSTVLADQGVYEHLVDDILAQRLLPGERLSEESLVGLYKVSRTTVRKVLQRLAAEDILDIRPNCGATVAHTPPERVHEYLAARRLIEGELASLASLHATTADIDALRALHATELELLAARDRGAALRQASELHFAIARCAGNAPLAEAARRLICRNQLIIAQYERTDADAGCACTDHAGMIDAIAQGDPELARRTMVNHLDGLANRLTVLSVETPAEAHNRKRA